MLVEPNLFLFVTERIKRFWWSCHGMTVVFLPAFPVKIKLLHSLGTSMSPKMALAALWTAWFEAEKYSDDTDESRTDHCTDYRENNPKKYSAVVMS